METNTLLQTLYIMIFVVAIIYVNCSQLRQDDC